MALAFKEFSWLILPFLVNYVRRNQGQWALYSAVSIGVAVLFTLPFFVTAPGGLLHNLWAGLTYHRNIFGLDVWAAAQRIGFAPPEALSTAAVLIGTAVVALLLLSHPARRLDAAVFQGLAVLCTALLLARYATSSYYMFGCAVASTALVLFLGETTRVGNAPTDPG